MGRTLVQPFDAIRNPGPAGTPTTAGGLLILKTFAQGALAASKFGAPVTIPMIAKGGDDNTTPAAQSGSIDRVILYIANNASAAVAKPDVTILFSDTLPVHAFAAAAALPPAPVAGPVPTTVIGYVEVATGDWLVPAGGNSDFAFVEKRIANAPLTFHGVANLYAWAWVRVGSVSIPATTTQLSMRSWIRRES